MVSLKERVLWSTPVDIPGTEIFYATNSQRSWCHYHETYAICNIAAQSTADQIKRFRGLGEREFYQKDSPGNVTSLMLVGPGELFRIRSSPPPNPLMAVLLDPCVINNIALESGLKPNPIFKGPIIDDLNLHRMFVQLHSSLRVHKPSLGRQQLLVDFVGKLLRSQCRETTPSAPKTARSKKVHRARDFILNHVEESIRLHSLAQIAELSQYHFLRAFAREFGLPPHQYLTSVRIWRARMSIKKIGPSYFQIASSAFSDQSHFIRLFKAAMGVTPETYAGMVRWPT